MERITCQFKGGIIWTPQGLTGCQLHAHMHAHTHTQGQFRDTGLPIKHVFGLWEKSRVNPHMDEENRHIPHRKDPARIQPGALPL